MEVVTMRFFIKHFFIHFVAVYENSVFTSMCVQYYLYNIIYMCVCEPVYPLEILVLDILANLHELYENIGIFI